MMNLKKDLIIVHFQEGFFNDKNQRLKNIVKKEVQRLINRALKDKDTRIGFWLDSKVSNPRSVVPIPKGNKNVVVEEAPCGSNEAYSLGSNNVILTGGWFGACIRFSITSLMVVFLENSKLVKRGVLNIRLKRKGIYQENELLEKLEKSNIKKHILRSFDTSVVNSSIVKKKGLQVKMTESTSSVPFFEKIIANPQDSQQNPGRITIVFIID